MFLLFQGGIFRFHVCFGWCNYTLSLPSSNGSFLWVNKTRSGGELVFLNKKGGDRTVSMEHEPYSVKELFSWVATHFQRQDDRKKTKTLKLYLILLPKIITFQRGFLLYNSTTLCTPLKFNRDTLAKIF